MTLDEIRDEIWEGIGKDTRYDPDEDTSYDNGPYLTFVANEAQKQIATWKSPRGGIVRFRELIGELFFQSAFVEGTVASATTTAVTLDSSVDANADQYEGWVLEVGGETKLITSYTAGRAATVHEAYGTAPSAGDDYDLYKRFFYFLPSTHDWVADHISLPGESDRYRTTGNLLEPLKIVDLVDQTDLDHAVRDEYFPRFVVSKGDPTQWGMIGKRLVFDTNVAESKWFMLEYYRMPTDMSAATDEPEIPEQFHYALVLWGIWWGMRRKRDSKAAYSTKRDLQDFMVTTIGNYEIATERGDSSVVLTGRE